MVIESDSSQKTGADHVATGEGVYIIMGERRLVPTRMSATDGAPVGSSIHGETLRGCVVEIKSIHLTDLVSAAAAAICLERLHLIASRWLKTLGALPKNCHGLPSAAISDCEIVTVVAIDHWAKLW